MPSSGPPPAMQARKLTLVGATSSDQVGAPGQSVAGTAEGRAPGEVQALAPPAREARRAARRDYGGYLARLAVLGGAFAGGFALNLVAVANPYFLLLILGGVVGVCAAMLIRRRGAGRFVRVAVPLLDVAWILTAMYLTSGLQSFLLPLLYVVVALAMTRGGKWETGVTLGGAVTGVFALGAVHLQGGSLAPATAQVMLLMASALAVRLIAVADRAGRVAADPATSALYEALLETTSDAVLNVDLETWAVSYCNPAGSRLCAAAGDEGQVVGGMLAEVVGLTDKAFLKACRKRINEEEFVRGAVTKAALGGEEPVQVVVSMTPARVGGAVAYVQVVMRALAEGEAAGAASAGWPGYDFASHYIPSLTHELNNHLAIIRLSAEVAATTGKLPDFEMIQGQVDHCQEVLQMVVMQILRAGAPAQSAATSATTDLQKAIEHSLLLTRPQVLTTGVQLKLRLPEEPLPTVRGHAYELQEALVRIILHAAEAMCHHEHPRTLEFEVWREGEDVELCLSDLGPGLKRGALATINGIPGAGSRAEHRVWDIVRQGITRSGGRLAAENGLNGGTRFRITLPVVEVQ